MKSEYTGSKNGRHIFRSLNQEYIDRVKAYHETEAYKKTSRIRSVWVEPLLDEAKDFHRLRGLNKVNIEGTMIAAGHNLKRLYGIATLVVVPVFGRTRSERWIKTVFLVNGLIGVAVGIAYAFGVIALLPLAILGLIAASIAYPLLALRFLRAVKAD